MATILPFPARKRRTPRHAAQAIPSRYRLLARVESHPFQPRQILSQLWTALLTLALIALAVDIASAAPAATAAANAAVDDIRDIQPPVHIAPSWMWLVYLFGAIVVAMALYALVKWWRARAKARAKLPYEIALEALAQARALMVPDKVREYSFRVSEITRHYIEARFKARAAHRTTEEFLHDLVDNPTGGLAQHAPLLEDFLKHCDLAKFARWTLSQDEMEKMHLSAVTFVNQTRPMLEPETKKEIVSSEK